MATALSTATATLIPAPQPHRVASSTGSYSLLTAAPAVAVHPLLSSSLGAAALIRRRGAVLRKVTPSDDRVELGENSEGIISGEWPENSSLLSFDDLRAYFEPQILKDKMSPTAPLREVMSTDIRSARPDHTLEEIEHYFEVVSGFPVTDEQGKCVGVVSKRDLDKASDGLKSKVSEVMSSPAITLPPEKTVTDAAALMLKMKIHRIPILDKEGKVIGMVTRTDIFKALEVAVASA